MSDKLGQEPAFSFPAYTDPMAGKGQNNTHKANNGMSKRFYAACAAMQGFLSMGSINPNSLRKSDFSNIISESYRAADELLTQEHDDSGGV